MPYIHRIRPDRAAIVALIADRHDGNVSAAARAAGLAHATLHDILSGRRDGREETLQALADSLEVDLEDITVEVGIRGAA